VYVCSENIDVLPIIERRTKKPREREREEE
jgi:hypothetical protein